MLQVKIAPLTMLDGVLEADTPELWLALPFHSSRVVVSSGEYDGGVLRLYYRRSNFSPNFNWSVLANWKFGSL